MTRPQTPDGRRNLIAFKVSDGLNDRIEQARGDRSLADFGRWCFQYALDATGHGSLIDWERRAREAERKLEEIRMIMEGPQGN